MFYFQPVVVSPTQPCSAYGMTECCGKISSLATQARDALNHTERDFYTMLRRRPFMMIEVRIVDGSGTRCLVIQKLQEMCNRGPTVFGGYWNDEAATKSVFTADGWFCTGDVGIRHSHGYISIVDRRKDMLLVGAKCVQCRSRTGSYVCS